MYLPIKWLKEYVDIDEDIRVITDGLTYSGSHIESIMSMDKGIENVVVGRIVEITAHPDADKLVICQIDVGQDEKLQIVTGAPNVREGQLVPVALVGAKLAGGLKIKKSKLRGKESLGMLCSLEELGYPDNVISKEADAGIYILDEGVELGTKIQDVLGMDEHILEIEITPNRPDCLSIIGMARETGATFNKKVREPEIKIQDEVDDIGDYIGDIEIESDNCDRYYARVIKDVEIKQSPVWLQVRLMEAGMRPINNIVDIANYVMLEFGQPLHTFDLDKIKGKKVIVRQGKEGEVIKTLDGEDRKLNEDDLVIADKEEVIAIAGVMGGFDSEITKDTNTVFIESAAFNQKSVRLTSKKFNLRSEASSRFEKGIDPNLAKKAGDRFCQLIEELEAGKVVKGNIDKYENVFEERIISLRPERVNKILGTELKEEEMIVYLEGLGFNVEKGDNLIVRVPTYRLDILAEVDLIEEIARLYGFHNIEAKPLIGTLTRGEKPYKRVVEDKAKGLLSSQGLSEILTYSFISPKSYDKLRMDEKDERRNYIPLLNPLGEDYSVMRRTLLSNMMETLSRNYNRKIEEVFLYEIGNLFEAKQIPIVDLPMERRFLAIGGYGEDIDFYSLKSIIEEMLNRLGIYNLDFIREEDNPIFHPGRTAELQFQGQSLGVLGEVHEDTGKNYDIKDRVYMAELDFDLIVSLSNLDTKFKELPKYPAVVRDLALVLDESIMVGEIEKIINSHGKGLIEKVELFDIYTGDQIPDGKKSVAYSITYRSYEKTLTDEEINKVQEKLIEDLEERLDAELRS